MGDTEKEKERGGSVRRFLSWSLLIAVFLGGICTLTLKIYLATPAPAARFSRLLTACLHQSFRVTGLHMDGGVLYLTKVALANPSATPGYLMKADSITIAPNWGKLLHGQLSFQNITISGLSLDLRKNSAGVWNFTELQKLFGGKKPSGEELFIGRFVVRDGTFQVNGRGVAGINLQLSNFSTKGSRSAGIELIFEDSVRNRYIVKGKTRPGPDPEFDLTLAAPTLSMVNLAGLLKPENRAPVQGGTASLRAVAGFHHGHLQMAGHLDFSGLRLKLDKRTFPLTGNLNIIAAYNRSTDKARLESLSLTTNNLVRAHAAGTVEGLKNVRSFAVTIAVNELDLAGFALLLPEIERRKTVIGGKLSGMEIRLAGNARGLTDAVGSLLLRDCSLERGGQLLFKGLDGSMKLSREAAGILAHGRLSLQGPRGSALLQALDAPFDLRLSPRMKLSTAEIPSLTATVMGLGLTGGLGFNAAKAVPFSLALRIPDAPFSVLQPIQKKVGLHLSSGSGSLELEARGKGVRDFNMTVNSRLAALQGARGGNRFGLKNAATDSRLIMSNGRLNVAGNASFSGLSIGAGGGEGHFSYRSANGMAALENVVVRFAGMSATIARLTARIPGKETVAGTTRYPLLLKIAGGNFKQGPASLGGLSGLLRGGYVSDQHGGWLEGTADVAALQVAWEGKPVSSPSVRAVFSREGGHGAVSGTLMGGSLNGDMVFKTSAPAEGLLFHVGIKNLHVARIGELLPRTGAVTLNDGTLDITAGGRFSKAGGVACRFDMRGAGIATKGRGGKTLFSGGGVKLAGEIDGQRILLSNALLSVGEGVSLKVNGTVTNPLTLQREGKFSFSLPVTSLNSIIDPFVNMLPRFIQESTVDGSVAADGTVNLHDGRQLVDGTLKLQKVLMEVTSQNFKTTNINGNLPFSFDLSGGIPFRIQNVSNSFTRKNYPRLLEQLRAAPVGGQSITIDSTSFGSLALGEVKLQVTAGDGITKITSLRSSLYEGALLGTGFVEVKNGLHYRTDVLINGLSLKQFCATIPTIKDYISGRLDGVISVSGEGRGMAGLTGYSNLWVREGSGEKMLVSKTFLQKLAGKNLSGFFFRTDRSFDQAEIIAVLEEGDLTFDMLDISNTNLFGVRDLSVSVASSQNRIALDHLLTAIKQATVRGKAASGSGPPAEAPAEPAFKWQE